MTFDDDYITVTLPLTGQVFTLPLFALGLEWPPPARLFVGNQGEIREATDDDPNTNTLWRSSMSDLSDEERTELTGVARGAAYVPVRYQENGEASPKPRRSSGVPTPLARAAERARASDVVPVGTDGACYGLATRPTGMHCVVTLMGEVPAPELRVMRQGVVVLHGCRDDLVLLVPHAAQILDLAKERVPETERISLKACANGCTPEGLVVLETADEIGLRQVALLLYLDRETNQLEVRLPVKEGIMARHTPS